MRYVLKPAAILAALCSVVLPADAAPSEPTAGTSALEGMPVPACADLFDNDGDGKVDFPDDPDCSSLRDASEDAPRGREESGAGPDARVDGYSVTVRKRQRLAGGKPRLMVAAGAAKSIEVSALGKISLGRFGTFAIRSGERRAEAGERVSLRLELAVPERAGLLRRKLRRFVRARREAGRRATARAAVRVSATDGAGNTAQVKRVVRVR